MVHVSSSAFFNTYVEGLEHDSLPVQSIGYLENIELPPTRLDVVQKALQIADNVRKECNEDHIIVAYDLVIAKIAMHIQETENSQPP